MKEYNTTYASVIALVVTLGGLLFGYDTAVISGTVSALEYQFVLPLEFMENQAAGLLGFIVASALIGCIAGSLIAGYSSEMLGPKLSLILSAFLFLISALGSAWPEAGMPSTLSQGYITSAFIFYRIIGGIGVGMVSMLSPMYISEIAPSKIRGRLVSFNQLAIVSGMIVVYFVNYIIAMQGDDTYLHQTGWRHMFASEAIPAILFLVLLFFIPQSPRWLTMRGRESEAARVLGRINNPQVAQRLLADIKMSRGQIVENIFSYGKRLLFIGFSLAIFQQFIGINVALYYAPEIFKNIGASTESALFTTIWVGAINLTFTVIAILLVDHIGRRPLLLAGSLAMAFSMIGLGLSFVFDTLTFNALLFMLLYVAAFAVSWGPVMWVLLSEMFPNMIRGKAMAICTFIVWTANFIVSWTFPIMDKSVWLTDLFNKGFPYLVYGLVAIVSFIFVFRFIPETKGQTLEEIEIIWKGV